MQLQYENLNRQDIRLEMFINGQDLIDRFVEVLDKIQPDKLDPNVKDIQPVKLVICDINMPVMDGWKARKRV